MRCSGQRRPALHYHAQLHTALRARTWTKSRTNSHCIAWEATRLTQPCPASILCLPARRSTALQASAHHHPVRLATSLRALPLLAYVWPSTIICIALRRSRSCRPVLSLVPVALPPSDLPTRIPCCPAALRTWRGRSCLVARPQRRCAPKSLLLPELGQNHRCGEPIPMLFTPVSRQISTVNQHA
jgi:hypothetical protein